MWEIFMSSNSISSVIGQILSLIAIYISLTFIQRLVFSAADNKITRDELLNSIPGLIGTLLVTTVFTTDKTLTIAGNIALLLGIVQVLVAMKGKEASKQGNAK